MQRPDPLVQGRGPLAPVELGHGLGEHGGVGREGVVLRGGLQGALEPRAEGVDEGLGPDLGEALREDIGRLVGADRGACLQEHGAGIQALLHLHGGDPGLGVAVQDGPLDRGGAAIAGQERGVDVDAAEGRQVQDRLRQDLAVGDDHDEVGGQGLERREGLLVAAQALRLVDRDPGFEGSLLDRGHGDLLAAPHRPIGLGEDGLDVVAGREEGLERGDGERGGAHEDDGLGQGGLL
ncbi:hypothetical protein D3C86_1546230 [compost metagenome]